MVSNVNAIFVPEASIRHTIKTVLLDQSSLDRVEGGVYMDMLCWKSLVDSMLAKNGFVYCLHVRYIGSTCVCK